MILDRILLQFLLLLKAFLILLLSRFLRVLRSLRGGLYLNNGALTPSAYPVIFANNFKVLPDS
jgi:hypothetical protein